VAAFPPFACATCGWIALVPAWWVITRSEAARRQPIRHGYLLGLIYFGGTFWWIADVTPVATVLLILYLALYPGIWFLFVARLVLPVIGAGSVGALLRAGVAASFWVTLEWWRSWFLTGFDWNEVGASQSPSIVFRQMAAFGGVPLLSFLLVTVNILWAEGLVGIAERLRRERVVRVTLPFGAALLLVALMFALGSHHLLRHRGEALKTGPDFAAIQPNIPQLADAGGDFQHGEDVALEREVSLSDAATMSKPELLIWPEAIVSEGVFTDRPLNEAVHGILQNFDGWFLLGSQDFDYRAHKLYNVAFLFAPGGSSGQEYRKTHLVVGGEYLPVSEKMMWLRRDLGLGDIDFSPGPGPVKFTMTKPAVSFAPLICFEDTLADVAQRAARLRPDFFVTITNDGWYTGWFAQWGVRQHLALAVFRCVEQDRPMIRCANTGISCVIDPNGTVTERLRDGAGKSIDVGGVFRGTLRFYPAGGTLYEAWGDWIVLISGAVSVMVGGWALLRNRGVRRES
jgi:apolipoprotein N-acyltransferase